MPLCHLTTALGNNSDRNQRKRKTSQAVGSDIAFGRASLKSALETYACKHIREPVASILSIEPSSKIINPSGATLYTSPLSKVRGENPVQSQICSILAHERSGTGRASASTQSLSHIRLAATLAAAPLACT